MDPKIIFIIGRSGCGKGTQAKLLAEKLRVEYIGSGDMLRARQRTDDFTGRKVSAVMDKTIRFAPTAIIFKLWVDKFEAIKEKPGFRGFVVDGSPRKIREAELIDETLEWFEWNNYTHVILIDVSREESFRRLTKRARQDDTREAINHRLDSFEEEVTAVITYYEKSKRLTRVNGEQNVQDIHKDIMKVIL